MFNSNRAASTTQNTTSFPAKGCSVFPIELFKSRLQSTVELSGIENIPQGKLLPQFFEKNKFKETKIVNLHELEDAACYVCGYKFTHVVLKTRSNKIRFVSFNGGVTSEDHLVPRSKGGKSTKENLRQVCNTCNRVKDSNFIVDLKSNPYYKRFVSIKKDIKYFRKHNNLVPFSLVIQFCMNAQFNKDLKIPNFITGKIFENWNKFEEHFSICIKIPEYIPVRDCSGPDKWKSPIFAE